MTSKIHQIMKEKKFSDRSLAAKTGVSSATIWKAKFNPIECSMISLKKIADALGVDVCDLFTEE